MKDGAPGAEMKQAQVLQCLLMIKNDLDGIFTSVNSVENSSVGFWKRSKTNYHNCVLKS